MIEGDAPEYLAQPPWIGPVLGMSLLLVAMDHLWGMGLFDPQLGGDPVLFQHPAP